MFFLFKDFFTFTKIHLQNTFTKLLPQKIHFQKMHFQNCSLKKYTFQKILFKSCFLKKCMFSKLLAQKNTFSKLHSHMMKKENFQNTFSKLLA